MKQYYFSHKNLFLAATCNDFADCLDTDLCVHFPQASSLTSTGVSIFSNIHTCMHARSIVFGGGGPKWP